MILTLLFQFSKTQDDPDADSVPFFHLIQTDSNQIHPSLAVVIGVLFILLFITLFFVAYTKFCVTNPLHFNNQLDFHGLIRSGSRLSGLDRTVVESLPFFRFSSLKGFKQGLECAVCISKFQEIEILRLLPNCNHAFHIDCIDRWLENHSTCPLCRYKIDAGDLQNFIYSNSSRSLARKVPSNLTVTEDLNLDLFIQREQAHDHDQHHDSSSRFKVGISSFRKNMDTKFLHKLKHKIVISDVVVRNRWSDVNSSDFLSLNSEMLGVMSSQRFSPTKSNSKINASDSVPTLSCFPSTSSSIFTEQSSTGQLLINTSEKRSMSEITNLSRFTEFNIISNYNKPSKGSGSDVNGSKEERMKSIWLQIARGTVKWFAGTERISEEFKYKRQPLNV